MIDTNNLDKNYVEGKIEEAHKVTNDIVDEFLGKRKVPLAVFIIAIQNLNAAVEDYMKQIELSLLPEEKLKADLAVERLYDEIFDKKR